MTDQLHSPRPFRLWHEDRGNVLWWRMPISEPPYVGTPLDLGRDIEVQVGDGVSLKVAEVGGWPFDAVDEPDLWWTPLPDAQSIQEQVPQYRPAPDRLQGEDVGV